MRVWRVLRAAIALWAIRSPSALSRKARYGLFFFASLRIYVVSVATRAAGTYRSTPPCPWASFLVSASNRQKRDDFALSRYRSIRALGYAIAPHGAIRSACRPISPVGLNTGSGRGYVLGLGPLRAYAAPALRFARAMHRSKVPMPPIKIAE